MVILVSGGLLSISMLVVSYRILKAPSGEFSRNHERIAGIKNLLRGTIPTKHGVARDFRVRAGLAITPDNQWEEQGALSEEAIDSVLQRR